jgi:nucleoside-triphosphatase THEP1
MTLPKILILTGDRGVGKTTWILSLCRYWKGLKRPYFGTAEPKIFEQEKMTGIAVLDLVSGRKKPFAVRDDEPGLRLGPWRFLQEGVDFANQCYQLGGVDETAVIDEIGALEMKGHGLTVPWLALQEGRYRRAVAAVQPKLVEMVGSRIAGDVRVVRMSSEILRMSPEEMDRFVEKNLG